MGTRMTPGMEDGRAFTNYMSPGIFNSVMKQKLGIVASDRALDATADQRYRLFIQNNGSKVVDLLGRCKDLNTGLKPPNAMPDGPLRPQGPDGPVCTTGSNMFGR